MKKISLIYISLILAGIIGLGILDMNQSKDYRKKITDLQGQFNNLSSSINVLQQQTTTPEQSTTTSQNKTTQSQIIEPQTQEQLITSAVAKITPSVVSIIISKDMPDLDVAYVNPFGDNPYFKDFDLEVPVFQQKGISKQEVGAGTGLIIHTDGYILTNSHVVSDANAEYTMLLWNGSQKKAKVLFKDQVHDVAILKIDGSYPTTASLGDSSTLKLGQTVIAVGNALGEYNNTVSTGIVSGLNRNIVAGDENSTTTEKLNGVIQTDVSVNPGNSGGPLTDLNGDVIGINVATAVGSNNINFSIPINSVKDSIKKMLPL